jgi:hypothetical protein
MEDGRIQHVLPLGTLTLLVIYEHPGTGVLSTPRSDDAWPQDF